MIEEAKIISIAKRLLDHLKGDEELKPLMLEELIYSSDQVSKVKVRTASYKGVITLKVEPSLSLFPESPRALCFTGQIILIAWVSNIPPEGWDSAEFYALSLIERSLRRAASFEAGGGAYSKLTYSDIMNTDIPQLNIPNVTAYCVVLSITHSVGKPL